MSLSVILKNVYSFLDVLQLSHTDAVAQWDRQALDNALQWARYCQQICQQSEGKPYRGELEHQIAKLGCLPWSLGSRTVDMKLLATATQELSLILIQNRHLNSHLFECLLKKTCDFHHGSDMLVNLCFDVSSLKSAAHLSHTFHKHLGYSSNCDDVGLPLEVLQAYARLVLDHVSAILNKVTEDKRERTDSLLKKKIRKILDVQHGNDILLSALTLTWVDPAVSSPTPAQTAILHLVEHCVTQDPEKAKKLWSASTVLLSQVSVSYPGLYEAYMSHLSRLGDQMYPDYPPFDPDVCHPAALVKWRSPTADGMTYEQLLHHCHTLVQTDCHLAEKTTSLLHSLVNNSECNVWHYILKDLDRLKNQSAK